MSVNRRRSVRRTLAIVGVGILVAALYWAGSGAVLAAMARCSPTAVVLAAAAIAGATVLGAWNCHRIAELETTITFARFLPVFWRSWAVGITLPGQIADFLTTLWQLKGRSSDLNFVAGRLIVDKAITLSLTLALLTIVPVVVGKARPVLSLLLLAALCLGATGTLAVLAWCRRHPEALARRAWGARINPVLASLNVPARLVAGNAAVTCLKVLLSGVAYWVVLRSIASAAPDFTTTTVISQTAGLIAYVPISFNGLGTVEISAVAMFGAIGLDSPSVLSAYLILRGITLTAAWLPTLAFTLHESVGPAP